jgi:hypothetical protein
MSPKRLNEQLYKNILQKIQMLQMQWETACLPLTKCSSFMHLYFCCFIIRLKPLIQKEYTCKSAAFFFFQAGELTLWCVCVYLPYIPQCPVLYHYSMHSRTSVQVHGSNYSSCCSYGLTSEHSKLLWLWGFASLSLLFSTQWPTSTSLVI